MYWFGLKQLNKDLSIFIRCLESEISGVSVYVNNILMAWNTMSILNMLK